MRAASLKSLCLLGIINAKQSFKSEKNGTVLSLQSILWILYTALALLSRMEELHDMKVTPLIEPDVKSYTKVIDAIARLGENDAGKRAEELLNRMIEDEVH